MTAEIRDGEEPPARQRAPTDARSTVGGASYRLGLLLVTGSAFAWSLAGFFTRAIHVDVWTMLAWRGVFGAVGIAALALALEGVGALASLRRLGWPGWWYAVVSAGGMVLFIASLGRTTVAHVAVIYSTVPFFAALLGWWFLREAPSRAALAASCAAMGGVALMVGFGSEGGPFGDALALGMTVAMAAMMVIVRRFRDIPSMTAAALSALLSGLVCWPFGHPASVTGGELLLLLLFGLVNSAVGLALFTLGARLLPPVETALIGALDAPLAPLWVWLAFAEAPSFGTASGGLIVFAAVGVYLAFAASRRGPSRSEVPGCRTS